MKVAHAGEHGAVQIYRGQMVSARLTVPDLLPLLAEFAEHERSHRAIFAAELARRNRPRCTSYRLCGLGGWCLGFVTGLLGRKAIAATTVAVERTVLRHLDQYRLLLRESDPVGFAAVSAILADEQNHHDALLPDARGWASRWIGSAVAGSTEAVIWLGMRL
ncbi:MAG TPA: demethoxyubiquinone hydroxylase family protein [Sphingomonas sp.]|nr:demethoxyubiquinone hydroxylase family protein [Sphingomonas sp.]